MRKLATTTAAVAVMLTGLAGASTSSDAADSSGPAPTEHVIRLVSVQIEAHKVAPNHSTGTDRLRFRGNHAIAGYESFSSHFHPKTDRLQFWLADALEGGIIMSYFDLDTSKAGDTFNGRITGGTGSYLGAEGTIHVRSNFHGRALYTLHYTQ